MCQSLFVSRKCGQALMILCAGSTRRGLPHWQGGRPRRADRAGHCLHLSRLQVVFSTEETSFPNTQFRLAGRQSEGNSSPGRWFLEDSVKLYLHARWQIQTLSRFGNDERMSRWLVWCSQRTVKCGAQPSPGIQPLPPTSPPPHFFQTHGRPPWLQSAPPPWSRCFGWQDPPLHDN